MSTKTFQIAVMSVGILFALFFCATIIPALAPDYHVVRAAMAGFVNPFSSGYAADAIACWLVLCIWVLYERAAYAIRYGWLCLLLGIVPGVALGFALYLVTRQKQMQSRT